MKHQSYRSLALGCCLALTVPQVLAEARVPKPNPYFGDGRVSAFYTWDDTIPAEPGRLLRREELDSAVGLSSAERQFRILYSSIDGVTGKAPVTVSGALFIPPGEAPEGGWPVVAWGHGTLGIADICAPSWQGRSYRDVRYLNAWLDEGLAVVASDYQGIGVPGPNPQFNNRANAHSILDSVRAAQHALPGEISNKVLLVGQSQGGSAVVVAAGYAPEYAPDLDVRGTIGTGIVYRPDRELPQVRPADPEQANRPDPGIAYGFYHVIAAQAFDFSIKGEDIYTDLALPLLDQARTHCLATLTSDVLGLGLTRATALKSADGSREYDAPHDDVGRPFPTVKLTQPLFIGVGLDDGLVSSAVALAGDACAAGTRAQLHIYPSRDHSGAVNESLRDSLPFARKVLAGEPIEPRCEAGF